MKRRLRPRLTRLQQTKTARTLTNDFVLLVARLAVGLVSDTTATGMRRGNLSCGWGQPVPVVRLPRCPKAQRNRAVEDEQHRVKRAHGRSLGRSSPTVLERDRSGSKIVPPMRWRRRESLRDHACAPSRDNHRGRSPARTVIDQRRRVIDHLPHRRVPSTVAWPAPVRGGRAGGNRGQDESGKHRASDLARDLGHCRCSVGRPQGRSRSQQLPTCIDPGRRGKTVDHPFQLLPRSAAIVRDVP
jgi:hypothetical protein